jgi:hypothetical protein
MKNRGKRAGKTCSVAQLLDEMKKAVDLGAVKLDDAVMFISDAGTAITITTVCAIGLSGGNAMILRGEEMDEKILMIDNSNKEQSSDC